MEYLQSSPAIQPSKEVLEVNCKKQVIGERGRNVNAKENSEVSKESIKDIIEVSHLGGFIVLDLDLNLTDTESESEYSRSDESDVEDNEEDPERVLILNDAKKLKVLATAFLHPELSVSVDCAATARCYFDRNSAAEQEDFDFAEEKAKILVDAAALKNLAVDYAHPEIGVTSVDATACGRNYFSRASAIEQEDEVNAEERAQVLSDAAFLKKLAGDYAHPELGLAATDSTVFARNYFSRVSAIEQDGEYYAVERAQILADAAALKRLAVDYAHPEHGISVVEASAFGRNYFSRPSTIEQEDESEAEERAQILADTASLKRLAIDYAHPEIHVSTTEATAFGRNYFSRASAIEQEDEGDMNEMAQVLADAASLKRLAIDYAHPEIHVSTTEATAFGRNYFSRASAIEQEDEGDMNEMAQVLADATSLKRLAVDYSHPEHGVSTTDATAFGRNYFSRASAIEQEHDSQVEERTQVLADAASLKRLAIDYSHPEHGVSTTDATAFGRNYFSRASTVEQEHESEVEERAQVLADATSLKKLTVDYSHPEHGVSTTDATTFGRNYFTSPIVMQNLKKLIKTKIVQKQQPVISKSSSSKDAVHNKLSETPVGNVKRSPSTVILFGLGDDDGSAY